MWYTVTSADIHHAGNLGIGATPVVFQGENLGNVFLLKLLPASVIGPAPIQLGRSWRWPRRGICGDSLEMVAKSDADGVFVAGGFCGL
jgi:hypothetical protein